MRGPQACARASQRSSAPVSAVKHLILFSSPARTAVSFVTQNIGVSPLAPSAFLDKWGPSGLAFLGVIFTLFGKWLFDAWKQKREIKRRLYLKVADGIFEGALLLGSFSDTNRPLSQLANGFARCMAPLSKAELVAGNQLLLALSDLRDKFGPAYFSLLRERARIEPTLGRVRDRLPFIQQVTDRINANLSEQSRQVIEGIQPGEGQERFGRLQELFKGMMEQRESYYVDDARDNEVIHSSREEMNRLAMDHARELIVARVRVLAMMRKELKFRFNEKQYLKREIAMAKKAMAELDLTHQTIRESLKPANGDLGQGQNR